MTHEVCPDCNEILYRVSTKMQRNGITRYLVFPFMYCDHCKRFYPKIKRRDSVGEPSLALTDFEGLDATLDGL